MMSGICKGSSLLFSEYQHPSRIMLTWQEPAQLLASLSELKGYSKKTVRLSSVSSILDKFLLSKLIFLSLHSILTPPISSGEGHSILGITRNQLEEAQEEKELPLLPEFLQSELEMTWQEASEYQQLSMAFSALCPQLIDFHSGDKSRISYLMQRIHKRLQGNGYSDVCQWSISIVSRFNGSLDEKHDNLIVLSR